MIDGREKRNRWLAFELLLLNWVSEDECKDNHYLK